MIKPFTVVALLLGVQSVAQPPGGMKIDWTGGPFEDALARAEKENRSVLVYFRMQGSQHCGRFESDCLTNADVQGELGAFICYRADLADPATSGLVSRFSVTTLPTTLIVTSKASVDDALFGYQPVQEFLLQIRRIKSGQQTVTAYEKAMGAVPEDANRVFDLAMKLDWVGARERCLALLDDIRRGDPEGRTLIGARVILWRVTRAILDAAENPADPRTYDIQKLYDLMNRIRHEEVLFQGWNWASQVEMAKGRRTAARAATQQAWKNVPEEDLVIWGTEAVMEYWSYRAELTTQDRQFAFRVAKRVAARARRLDQKGDGGKGQALVARSLDAMACAYHIQGKQKQALAAVQKAVDIKSTGERLKLLKAIEQ